MKKTNLYLSVIVSVILASCHRVGIEPPPSPYDDIQVRSEHFIGAYVPLDTIKIQENASGPLYIDIFPSIDLKKQYNIFSTGSDAERFLAMAARNHDMAYPKTIQYNIYDNDTVFFTTCTDVEVVSINVTCDSDWDSVYKAGRSLNNLIRLSRNGIKRFIDSNYEEDLHPFKRGYIARLNNYTAEDFKFMFCRNYHHACLEFISKPAKREKKNVTITLRLSDGRSVKKSLALDYSRSEE